MNFFFWSKNGRFVTHICFPKKRPWNPYFYCVFWVRAFWAKVSKKGNFEKPHKKKKNLTGNWKANFGVFLLFFFGFFFFLFFFLFFSLFLFLFLLGSGEVARRATSLGPKPSFFLFFGFFGCFFFVFCFFWRVKGQVRWPKGPPHLALNPPYLFLLLFCFVFLSLVFCFVFFGCLIQKKSLVFP